MLNDNLYTINSFTSANGAIDAAICIDAGHQVFKGHFPGQPVLPGVCMMQIIKELTEKATGKKLFMSEAVQCKFLSMVDPLRNSLLQVRIDHTENESGQLEANAVLRVEDAVFLKMKCVYSNG